VTTQSKPTWPGAFRRDLTVLVVLLSVATIAVALMSLWQVHQVNSRGVHTEATALGAAPGGNGSQVYVRFLYGNEALIATADVPLWSPKHGTRVDVAFLPTDPRGSVTIVDARNSARHTVPAAAAVVAMGCLVAAVAVVRRDRAGGHLAERTS